LLWAIAIALILCAVWVRGAKLVVDVKRPPFVLSSQQMTVIGPAHRERSFPSGHATTAFAMAGILALGTRRRSVTTAALGAASVVALSRAVVGVHWPLDILASAAGGWLAAAAGMALAARWPVGMRPAAQTALTLVFAGFAVLLIAGYNTGYRDADWLLRSLGLAALSAFVLTLIPARSRAMNSTLPPHIVEASRTGYGGPPDVSLVIPVYNEGRTLPDLVSQVGDAMANTGLAFEIICVDDGSSDDSAAVLADLARERAWLRPVRLMRNYGQSIALQAGFDRARGAFIVTLDGDLQNNPYDIPRLLQLLQSRADVDVISGWRQQRQDGVLLRRLPSEAANKLISLVTGVPLHDYGCGLKAYRAHVIRNIRLYGEMHRFIPALAAEVGARILEVPVSHFPRRRGVSHYGIGRTPRVLLDLLWVKFLLQFLRRPMHAFGGVGLVLMLVGFSTLSYLAFDKLALGNDIGGRPLLVLGALLALIGVQLLGTGLLGELLIRIYHEPEGRRLYIVREETAPGSIRRLDESVPG
jgi:glycosyltransferase involved in cell wall biosynthesis